MAKRTKAGGGKKRNTEVTIIIQDHEAAEHQLDDLGALAMSLAPKFLAKIGATGKQFEVTTSNKWRHHQK
jgi:hypothetical protein